MRTLKTMAIASAMLFGATQVMAQQDQSSGEFIFEVNHTTTVDCNDANGTITGLIPSTDNDSKNATAEIVCDVETNRLLWDLKISSPDGATLTDGTDILKTDIVQDGKLGKDGSVWVYLKAGDATIGFKAVTALSDPSAFLGRIANDEGTEVDISTPNDRVSLADSYITGAKGFKNSSSGLMKATFGIKAGIRGNMIMSDNGTYRSEVSVTIDGGTI